MGKKRKAKTGPAAGWRVEVVERPVEELLPLARRPGVQAAYIWTVYTPDGKWAGSGFTFRLADGSYADGNLRPLR